METLLSRSASSDALKVELRGDIPREVADVLDAVSQARRVPRFELVNSILRDWAEDKLHEATLIVRVSRCEGSRPAFSGRQGE